MIPTSFTDILFQVPSIQHFLDSLVSDFANRRSVLVLLPVGIDPSLVWERLSLKLRSREINYAVVPVLARENTDAALPVVRLAESLDVSWPSPDTPRTAANLMAAKNLADVIYLSQMHELTEAASKEWLSFTTRWAQASHSIADQGGNPSTLCILVPAMYEGTDPGPGW